MRFGLWDSITMNGNGEPESGSMMSLETASRPETSPALSNTDLKVLAELSGYGEPKAGEPSTGSNLSDPTLRDRPSLKEQDEAERRAFKEMYGRSHSGMRFD